MIVDGVRFHDITILLPTAFGGSHGLLGAAICRKHPPMRSIVLDLPVAIKQARATAHRAGVDDVVEHRAGNVLAGDLPANVDVVLLANVIHHFTRDDAIRVLQKTNRNKAGRPIAVWDYDSPRPQRTSGTRGGCLFTVLSAYLDVASRTRRRLRCVAARSRIHGGWFETIGDGPCPGAGTRDEVSLLLSFIRSRQLP